MSQSAQSFGLLARQMGVCYPVQVLHSAAGFYIGTRDADGAPCSRESNEYFPLRSRADRALARGTWTQRLDP